MNSINNVIIYSVLNSDRGLWAVLGTPFQIAFEVKRAVIAVEGLLWNGFGSSFLDDCTFCGICMASNMFEIF